MHVHKNNKVFTRLEHKLKKHGSIQGNKGIFLEKKLYNVDFFNYFMRRAFFFQLQLQLKKGELL
jgi:hypothetical protein